MHESHQSIFKTGLHWLVNRKLRIYHMNSSALANEFARLYKGIDLKMGKNQSKPENQDSEEIQKTKRDIEEKGVEGALAMMREKTESWMEVEINIGVTGQSGVGKSSFINAIRGYSNFHFFVLLQFYQIIAWVCCKRTLS